MIKTFKIMLIPNNKQKTKLFQSAGVARFAYNWALNTEQENYKNGGSFLADNDLRKQFTKLLIVSAEDSMYPLIILEYPDTFVVKVIVLLTLSTAEIFPQVLISSLL